MTTAKKRAQRDNKPDPIEDIKAMWNALYAIGDKAMADMKEAAELGDIPRLKEAIRNWSVVTDGFGPLIKMDKLALHGRTFILGGQKEGGPIRLAIAHLLRHDHTLRNDELWKALTRKSPRGWTFLDNSAGKYIEGPKGGDNMNYARFRNIAAEERRKLLKE